MIILMIIQWKWVQFGLFNNFNFKKEKLMEDLDHFDIVDFIESTIEPKENVYNSWVELEDWVLEEALTIKNTEAQTL